MKPFSVFKFQPDDCRVCRDSECGHAWYHCCQIDVKEAKKVETHPQWEEVTDDEDKENDASDSDVTDSDDESE